jgi:hypothetical protein
VEEVIDLLQLAPAVLVELAVARQDVQFLEQFDRLPGPDFGDRRQGFPDGWWERIDILALCRPAALARVAGGRTNGIMAVFQLSDSFMAIQWYPGHMTSARKKAAETMASIDVVIEVVDARLPEASTNPMVRELRLHRQRPCLKVLNKADLADPLVTQAWIAYYNRQDGVRAVALSCKKPGEVARLPSLCQTLGAASQGQHQALADDDHGHPERRQIDADERPAQAQDCQGRRRAGGDQVAADLAARCPPFD